MDDTHRESFLPGSPEHVARSFVAACSDKNVEVARTCIVDDDDLIGLPIAPGFDQYVEALHANLEAFVETFPVIEQIVKVAR